MTISQLIYLLKADLLRLSTSTNGQVNSNVDWIKILNPRFTPVLLLRLARYFYLLKWLRFLSPFFTWLNVIVFGIEVTPKCEIGAGLFLPHTYGTVIGANIIGVNVTIFQGVTLGAKYADLSYNIDTRPIVEDNVMIGAGAKVLGGITIGIGARVAANSLVLDSVPDGVTVIGVPATIVHT